ncbi:unnamed protein product [Closterium sp. NIES-53]
MGRKAVAALGASESGTLPGTAPDEALHTFMLDSGTSRCFFHDSTTLTPLPAPVPVRLADPSGGPVVACPSTVLPSPVVPSGSLSGLHLPSFSTNLVSTTALQDAMITTTTPGGVRVRSGSTPLLVLPPVAPDPSVAPPPGSPLPATPSWHALPSPCLWSSQVSASPSSLACPALPSLRRGAAALRSSLLLVSPDDCSPVDSPHGRLRERFSTDLPVLRLHSDRGGEFSFNLFKDFYRGEGILMSFTLPDSPQQNGIAERRIGLVMEFYHPTSRRVLPSQDVTFDESIPFYRLFPYRSAPLPPPPTFLAPGPPLVDPLPPQGPAPSGVSQVDPPPGAVPGEVGVDSGATRGTASWGAEPGAAELGGVEPGGAEPGGAETGGAKPGGAETEGAEPVGVEPGGGESEGAESGGAEPQDAASSGGSAGASPRLPPQQLHEWLVRSGATEVGGAGVARAGGAGVPAGAGVTGDTAAIGPRGARTRGTGAAGTSGAEGAGAGDPTDSEAAGAGGSGASDAGAGGAGVGSTGPGGARAGGAGAGGAGDVDSGGAVRPRPYFVPLLQQVLGVPSSTGLTPPLLCPPPDQSQLPLQPPSPLPAPSPYTEQSGGLTERREPASPPVSPVCTARRVHRLRPPPVPGTHAMALRPSSIPLHVPLPAPPESSLPEFPNPESDRARATSPTVCRLLATTITDPSFESATTSALVTELLDFAATCRLDYATALVAESASATPPSVGGECALGTDVFEDRVKRPPGSPPAFKARYVARGFSQRQGVDYFQTFSPTPKMTTLRVLLHVAAQRDYELHSLDFSTAFLQGSLHEEIWLRRPPGFTESFPAGTQWSLRRPVYDLRQAPREWHDTLRTTLATLGFAPSTFDPSLFLRTDTSQLPFFVLVYVDDLIFATADTEALTLVKLELQKRNTCTDLYELRSYLGLQITRDRERHTITLTQSHMVHQILQRFGFQFSSPQSTPLSTGHSLSAPPSDESVEPSGPYPELVGCLVYLMTCTRPDLAYPLSLVARSVAPDRHRKVDWDAAKRVLRYLCSTSDMRLVLGGRGPVVLTGYADTSWADDSATQRLSQGYTSALALDLFPGGLPARLRFSASVVRPRSPPVLYVDNKAMIALCQEHRLEHKTKHIALRYFLARELQQRGPLRLAYVATRASTADVFTNALQPGDHQRFLTVLGLVPTLPHLLTS